MVPTSPTAILAVPERLPSERAEAKGVEGAEVPFAGLMAQFAQAPPPSERPSTVQPPAPGAPNQPRRPLPQAEVARLQRDTPSAEGSDSEGRVTRPRPAPEQPAKATRKAPTEETAPGPSHQAAPADRPVPAGLGLAIQPPAPVDAPVNTAELAAVAPVAGGPTLPAPLVAPGQRDGALPAPQPPGTGPAKGRVTGSVAPAPPEPSPEGKATPAVQPSVPNSQVPDAIPVKAATDAPKPLPTGSPAPARTTPARPQALPAEPALVVTRPALPAASPESTSGQEAKVPFAPAPVVASPDPRGTQAAPEEVVSARSGLEQPAPGLPQLPLTVASVPRALVAGVSQADAAHPDGELPSEAEAVPVPAWIPGGKQAQVPVVAATPSMAPAPALRSPDGPIPVQGGTPPSTPKATQPPVDPTVAPAAPSTAKPSVLPASEASPVGVSTPFLAPAGQTSLLAEPAAAPEVGAPIQTGVAVPAAALTVLASAPPRKTSASTAQAPSDQPVTSEVTPEATLAPSPAARASQRQPGTGVPLASPQPAATPVPINPEGPLRIGDLRATAAEPAASVKEALARQFPEALLPGVSVDNLVPVPRPAVSAPAPGRSPAVVERSVLQPATPAPMAASDRSQMTPEAPKAALASPERPETTATAPEGAVLKPVSGAQGLTLQGPDGSAMAASTGTRIQPPASTAGATPSQAPPPAPATTNPPMAQVEGGVRWMLRGGAQEAQLQLHPESLGQVTIHLRVEGGEVHARLWITDPASVQAVQEGRSHLEHSLREQGLQLGSFDLHQGHRPFQEAPPAPMVPARRAPEAVTARQEPPAAPALPILNPHHVELYA